MFPVPPSKSTKKISRSIHAVIILAVLLSLHYGLELSDNSLQNAFQKCENSA